jgi:hypothetical protein
MLKLVDLECVLYDVYNLLCFCQSSYNMDSTEHMIQNGLVHHQNRKKVLDFLVFWFHVDAPYLLLVVVRCIM